MEFGANLGILALGHRYRGYVSSSRGLIPAKFLRGARRPAGNAVDQIRVCYQPSNGASARQPGPAEPALHRGRDDRVEMLFAAVHEHQKSFSVMLNPPDGKTTEWKSRTLRAYQRRTLAADALIAGLLSCGGLAPRLDLLWRSRRRLDPRAV
jgi:hypothetical protein